MNVIGLILSDTDWPDVVVLVTAMLCLVIALFTVLLYRDEQKKREKS